MEQQTIGRALVVGGITSVLLGLAILWPVLKPPPDDTASDWKNDKTEEGEK